MSVTTQVTTFADMVEDLQNRVRVQTGVTAVSNVAKRYINTGLQDMHIGFTEDVPWAERSAELITQPEYTTGTVTITQGSTSLAGASTLWATANAFSVNNVRPGGKIVIDGGKEVYEVSSVTNDTALVLTSAFVGADVSAGSYLYFEDEYALHADFLRPVDFQNFDIRDEVQLISRKKFRERYPTNRVTGKPRVAAIFDKAPSGDTTPVRKVRLWQPPDAAYMLPYAFITDKLAVSSAGTAQTSLSAESDEPIVPLRYRFGIVLWGLKNWYRDKRDDDRSQEVANEYADFVTRMVDDQEIGRPRPHFRPRVGPYVSRARSPYRGARGGRYTTGSAFDEIRDR